MILFLLLSVKTKAFLYLMNSVNPLDPCYMNSFEISFFPPEDITGILQDTNNTA